MTQQKPVQSVISKFIHSETHVLSFISRQFCYAKYIKVVNSLNAHPQDDVIWDFIIVNHIGIAIDLRNRTQN